MCNFLLLVIQEIFKELLFLYLVITLADETMSTTDLIIAKNGSSHNLLEDELVFLIPNFMVNLTKSEPRQ